MNTRALIAALVAVGFAAPAAAVTDGTQGAVIAPTFYSTAANATQSYIRFFGGAGTLGTNTTFTVTLEGVPSGTQYGSGFTLNIPYMASVQYSVGQLIGFANAGALAGGDTGYAVYLRSTDPEAGYQHVTYNPVSALFENMSVCTSPIGERMLPLHSQTILTNVHTSKIANNSYPSTVYLYNPTLGPAQYTLKIFHGGNAGSSGATVSSTSGKYICQYQTQVQPNSIAAISEASLEAAQGCAVDSDQFYSTILVEANASGPPVATHLVRASAYSGDINLSQVCAVNKATLQLTTIPFVTSASTGATFQISGAAGIQAFNITGLSQGAGGGAVITATAMTNPTATVVTSSTGFNLTLPDGKTFALNTVPQSQGFGELGRYEANSADGTRHVEVFLNARRASTLTYATYGYWVESDGSGDTPVAIGTLATSNSGTAAASLPTTTLVYSGRFTGFAGTSANTGTFTNGTVSMTFNYAAKTVTGTVTALVGTGVESTTAGTANMLNLSGTITGNTFTGTVTAGPAVSGALFDLTGGTGTFSGTINGPNGYEVVGNINVNVTGGVGVGGAFGVRFN